MREIWSKLILTIQSPRVVTLIGGGGKTSLMHYLLTMLKDGGYAVVGTTTTKLTSQQVTGHSFVNIQSIEAGYQAVKQAKGIEEHIILVRGEDNHFPGKIIGIPGEWIDQLTTTCRDTVFIVEGDGAAGKPLKGHLAHEPVIPSSSSLVIAVIGIDSVGARFNSQHVHRRERICEMLEVSPDSLVTIDMITKLLFHPQGYLQHCPSHSVIIPFINKVESVEQRLQARELASKILACKHPQVYGVIVGSVMKEEGLWLQA